MAATHTEIVKALADYRDAVDLSAIDPDDPDVGDEFLRELNDAISMICAYTGVGEL